MTVPRFLASTFQFNELPAQVDMAVVITSIEALLTAQTPAWTNPSPGVLQSPVDSAGRFMTLVLDAPAANRLRMQVLDQNGLQVCFREIDLGGGPTTINVFSGQYHLYIESLTAGAGNGEWLAGMMIDPTDYDLQDSFNYVIGGGTRNSGGGVDGAGSVWDQWFMFEGSAPVQRQRSRAVMTAVGINAGLQDFAGNPQWFPFDVLCPNQWMGSVYQAYVTASFIGGGVVKPLAIDNATPAEFRTTVAGASGQGARLALRVS